MPSGWGGGGRGRRGARRCRCCRPLCRSQRRRPAAAGADKRGLVAPASSQSEPRCPLSSSSSAAARGSASRWATAALSRQRSFSASSASRGTAPEDRNSATRRGASRLVFPFFFSSARICAHNVSEKKRGLQREEKRKKKSRVSSPAKGFPSPFLFSLRFSPRRIAMLSRWYVEIALGARRGAG